VNTNKVVIMILQGSVVTETVLGGLATRIYPPVANFLQCVCQKLFKWVGTRQSYCNNSSRLIFSGPLCISHWI